MSFNFKKLDIPDVILIEPTVKGDGRGFFLETYKYSDFEKVGIKDKFCQDNHSKSDKKYTLRGLHYQLNPFSQGKLIRVISGEIFDVALDIRKGSRYYGKWVGVNLSSDNKNMLYVPPGFAHGFCTLCDLTEVVYKNTNIYSSKHERGIIWNDSDIGIGWPTNNPILSKRDSQHLTFAKADNNFVYSR